MSALRGIAAIMAGMGTGLVAGREDAEKKARQAKEDAWQQKERDRKEAEWTKADKLDSDLRMAGTPVAAEQPNDVLKDDDGNEMPAVPAFRAGTKRFTTMAEATQAAEAQNTPEAMASRTAAVYTANGKPMEAMDYQSRAAKLAQEQRDRIKNLEKEGVAETMSFLRSNNPDAAMKAFQSSGNMKLPEGAKFLKVDGTDIFTGKPGKVWSVIGPDGVTIVDDVGGRVAKYLGIEGQIGIDRDIRSSDAASAKLALEARKVEALEKNAETNAKKLDGLLLRGMGGSGAGARNGKADEVQQPSMPDPMAGFDGKRAYAVATEQAVAELASSGKPATPDQIAQRATAIYRSLEGEFKKTGLSSLAAQAFAQSARNAATPNDVAALYQQGLSHGMNPAQMVEIDPRMASLANPPKQETQKKETAKPSAPARPLTTFESMRQTKLSDEAAKSKTREQAEKEAREAERQRLLSQRPDLQQMGGMRFFN